MARQSYATGIEALVSDAIADDSDKTFVVPAGEEWELDRIFARLATTATVGNRIMQLQVTDGSDNPLYICRTAITHAASLTRNYQYGDLARDAAFVNDTANLPMPKLVLPAGYKIRIFDEAAIAVAADDLTVRILGYRRNV